MIPCLSLIVAIYCSVRLAWTIQRSKALEKGAPYVVAPAMIIGTYIAIGAITFLAVVILAKGG